jgi:hypothetical protein
MLNSNNNKNLEIQELIIPKCWLILTELGLRDLQAIQHPHIPRTPTPQRQDKRMLQIFYFIKLPFQLDLLVTMLLKFAEGEHLQTFQNESQVED